MRLQHIIEAVYARPWLITPAAHATIRELVETKLIDGNFVAQREPGMDICGNMIEVEQMENIDGIAVVPIGGVIARKLSAFERGAGAVDTADIMNDLREAEADDEVRGILLDVDSPGGMVNGTPELAEFIGGLDKRVWAYTAGTMASAAYWLGSAAEQVFATKSASIGSIGVYLPWVDSSRAMAAQGLEVDLIKSGKYKGAGFPGTSLTPEMRAHLQTEVDEIAADFRSFVREHRGGVEDSTMEGQSFSANQAYQHGLIDGVVADMDEVLGMMSEMMPGKRRRRMDY